MKIDKSTSRIIFCCKSIKLAEPRPKLLSPERPPNAPRPNGVALTSADCAIPRIPNYNSNKKYLASMSKCMPINHLGQSCLIAASEPVN